MLLIMDSNTGGPYKISAMLYILLNAIWLTPGGSTVQYTFTHKQHTDQHNETECTDPEHT